MLERHYAPGHKLVFGKWEDYAGQFEAERVALINFSSNKNGVPASQQFVLSKTATLEEAAQNLFAAIREADKMDIDLIIAEPVPEEGLGRAINDRLRRASKPLV
jgi:L-threonylcarbamoyladenylate synthase